MATLRAMLYENVRKGELYEKLDDKRIRCFACGHCCPIPDGRPGVCQVRFNRAGKLYVPWGYVGGVQCDPIEKKPFFHAYPGALAYSFGMLGCDLHCAYCQNWETSQALRNSAAVSPPLKGTPQVLNYLRPWVDLYKVDLKSFDDRRYRQLGGRLEPICDTIRGLDQLGFWVEIVTLLVPGFNDSENELKRLTEFLVSVSPNIPWHVTAFHKDYKMTDPENTSARDLMRAAEIGKKAGLRYIYAGNLPGQVGELENTYCPNCDELLIERYGYLITGYYLTSNGSCPSCGTTIPGRWDLSFQGQITDHPVRARLRQSSFSLLVPEGS